MSTPSFDLPGSAPGAACTREPDLEQAPPRSRRGRAALTAAGMSVVLVGSAGVASAQAVQPSTASLSGTTLQVTAGPGHANQITVFQAGAEIRVHDPARPILAVAPCLATLNPHLVRCPAALVQNIVVRLGDGNDVGRNATNRRSALLGGPGNDTLSGALAPDSFRGGPGTDLVTYADRSGGVKVTIDDVQDDGRAVPAELDDVRTDVENVTGGAGDDIIVGSAVPNVLRGLAGKDRLRGLAGPDTLFGDAGNDTLVGDAGSDQALGGLGADTCSAEVQVSCP